MPRIPALALAGASLLALGAVALAQAQPPADGLAGGSIVSGSVVNTGTLTGAGIRINGGVGGDVQNEGVIRSGGTGISIRGPVTGDVVNTGTIEAGRGYGIDAQGGISGSIANQGSIEAPAGAIHAGSPPASSRPGGK